MLPNLTRWGSLNGYRKADDLLHRDVVLPCLEALTRPGLETARAEMLKAHEAYRRGEYADAITDAGAAFESVMKTICEKKNWPYNTDKDTCKSLVDICQTNGLFASLLQPCIH
jgi:methionyl-tRNA synthetase